jgi:hypothetical protein
MTRPARKSLAAIALAMFVLLVGQTFACFVEQASLVPCIHECDHSHDSDPSGGTQENCDSTACHGSFVSVTHEGLAQIVPVIGDLRITDERAPDGPVREIDHPPQLS